MKTKLPRLVIPFLSGFFHKCDQDHRQSGFNESGVFERPSVEADHCHVHIEIFSVDDVPAFIANPKGDGKKKPTTLKVAEGAVLRTREKRFTEKQLQSTVTVGKDSNLLVLDSSDTDYLHLREHEMIRVLPHSFLKWQATSRNYVLAWENAAAASKVFDGYPFEREDTFTFVAYADLNGNKVGKDADPPNRFVKFVCDEENAERFWVKRSEVGDIKNGIVEPKADLNTVFRHNPNAIKFEKEAGTVTAESFCEIEACESAKDDKGALWYKIEAGGAEGWIAEDDPKLEKQSAFDWQGFKIIKEEGDSECDMLIDYKHVSPFFQKLFDEIDTSKDQKISQEEMQKALKDEKTSAKLSKLICYHSSEWWVDSAFSYWQPIFMRSSAEQKKLLEEQLKNLCWWDEVATKSNDLPLAPNVYHFHPVAFVEQMREISEYIALDTTERLRIMRIISEFEGDYSSCNKDSEFRMRSDQISYAGIVHIGLSWGFIQFTQDGGKLGKVLKLMASKDNSKFAEVFGDNWQELLETTNKNGASGQEEYEKKGGRKKSNEMRKAGTVIFGPRVRAVAVSKNGVKKHLWESPWLERFVKAGKITAFREAQHEIAISDYLEPALKLCKKHNIHTAKGVAIAFDRCVNQGEYGCKVMFKKLLERPLENEMQEQKFLFKIRDRWPSGHFIYHRLQKILDSKELGETKYDVQSYDD